MDSAIAVQSKFTFESPLGRLEASFTEQGLARLSFAGQDSDANDSPVGATIVDNPAMASTLQSELSRYFEGGLRAFSVPLDLRGTEFQLRVWRFLLEIPYGRTSSYGSIANQLGDPKSVRAVARANALNPVAILVPCHRVIGRDGNLTGYAGGLWRKRRLLQLEATGVIEETQVSLFTD